MSQAPPKRKQLFYEVILVIDVTGGICRKRKTLPKLGSLSQECTTLLNRPPPSQTKSAKLILEPDAT